MKKLLFFPVYLLSSLLTNACFLDSMETTTLKKLNQRLFDAVVANEPFKVKKLLNDGAELTCYRDYNYSAKHNHWIWDHLGRYQTLGGDKVTPFIAAVLEGNEQMVKLLLECGADIEITSNPWDYKETALHKAARMCSIPMLTLLLEHGANVHAVSNPHDGGSNGCGIYGPGKRTPLFCALQKSEYALDVVKLLIVHGAKVTVTDQAKQTPLHAAALFGNKQIVQLFIDNKAEINALDNFSETPLYNAVRSGSIETVQLLLSKGAKTCVKEADEPILHVAVSCKKAKPQIVEILLKAGVRTDLLNNFGMTAFNKACAWNKIECVKVLLKHNLDVNIKNKDDTIPLMTAVQGGNRALVQLLLDAGASVQATNSKGKAALHFAAAADLNVIKLLIKHGADVNATEEHGYTPLHLAVRFNREEVINYLIKQGADVNAPDYEGNTPLIKLCDAYSRYPDPSRLKLLIEHGANVNAVRSIDGASVLSFAAQWQDEEVVDLLLAHGASVTTKDDCSLTPLHYAAIGLGNKKYTVKKLLTHGAAIDQTTIAGQTALHLALEQRNIETALVLIESGASIQAVDNKGKTPLEVAYDEDAKYIFAYINK